MPLDEATRRRVRIRARALDYMAEEEAAPGGGAVEAPEPESPPLFGGAGFMGHAAEVPAGILRGFTGMGAGAMKGAALAGAGAGELMGGGESDPRQSSLYQAARGAEAWALRTGGEPNPNARFGAGAGEAIGSGLAAIPAAAAAFYAGLPAFGTAAVTGGLALLSGAGQDYEEKRAKGIDDATARMSAAAQGALQGITEPLGLGGSRFAGKMLGRVPSAIGRSIFREGGEEAGQELLQGVGGDVIDRIMTDPNQRIGENIGEKMLFGAIGGGVLGGAGSAVGERMRQRQAATAPPAPAPQPPPPTAPPAPITQAPDARPIKVSDRASITGQPDLGSFAGKGEILGNPNVDPAAPTAPLVAPDDPNAAPAPPPPESPLGKLGARQQFTPEEADRFQKVVGPWAKGMKVTLEADGTGARIEAPSGYAIHVSKVDRIPPEAIEGGPEMLAREIARNPDMDYGEGDPRGVTILPNEFDYKFTTADGLEFDTDTVVALAGGATPDTLPFELWRVSMANLLTGEEQRRIRRDFGTDEAAAAHYAQMVDRRTSHPVLWRMREFFQRLADWVGRGFKRDPQGQSKAIMRDVASGKMWNRPGTRMAAGPDQRMAKRRDAEDLARAAMETPVAAPVEPVAAPASPIPSEPGFDAIASMMEGSPPVGRTMAASADAATAAMGDMPRPVPVATPAPSPATVAPDATVQAPAAPTAPPTVTKGGGTRESPKAPPRPAKRVSKLPKPEKPMGLAGAIQSAVREGGKIDVTPAEAGELMRYIDSTHSGYRSALQGGFYGLWNFYFNLVDEGANVADMTGRARLGAEGGLKRLAPYLRSQLRVVAAQAANPDDAAKIMQDPDVPDILRALEVDDQNFYRSEAGADAAAASRNEEAYNREIAAMEREAYDADVAEGFEGSLEEWRAAQRAETERMERERPSQSEGLPFQPAKATFFSEGRGRSRRAEEAEAEGRAPLTRAVTEFRKAVAEAGIKPPSVAEAKAILEARHKAQAEGRSSRRGEWHHVGKFAKEVDYHDWATAADEYLGERNPALDFSYLSEFDEAMDEKASGDRARYQGDLEARINEAIAKAWPGLAFGRYPAATLSRAPGMTVEKAIERIRASQKLPSPAAFQPAKKDVFAARQATLPEMPKGPRPSSQRMFGLDLQPPAMETGANPDADPDTPDMFTGETAKPRPKAAKPRKAPGGQGSFGFQPAATTAEPHEMTRAEFEATGRKMLHGTPYSFERFSNVGGKTRSGRARGEGNIYFTTDRGIAQQFANVRAKQVSLSDGDSPWADRYDDDPEQAEADIREALDASIAKGARLFYDNDEGVEVQAESAKDVPLEALVDGNVTLFPPWHKRRIIETNIYGKTLDLTKPSSNPNKDVDTTGIPDSFFDAAGVSRAWVESNAAGDWWHERSPAITKWARENGYGKVDVLDSYESGKRSTIGVPEFTDYGRDPHREFVERALREGKTVPAEVLADYPDLSSNVAFQPEPQLHQREGDAIATASATQRKPKPDAALIAGAEKLAADPGAVEATLFKAAADGTVLTDEQTVAAYWVASEISVKAAASGDPADVDRAITTWRAYEKVGSEAGRALRARRVRTEAERVRAMIAESLFGMTPADAKAFDAAKTKEEKAKILARARKQTEARIAAAAKAGIDAPTALVGQELTESLGDFEVESIAKLEAELAKLNKASQAEKRNQIRAAIREVRRMAKDAPTLAGEEKAARRWASQRIKAIRKFLFGFQPGLADGIEAAFAPALKAMADRSGTNAVTGARIARAAQTVDAGFGDMAREWWINSILSGPQTQIVNVLSNVAEGLWTATMRAPETVFAEVARMVGLDRNGPTAGELREFYRGAAPGIAIGIRNGLRAWAIEDSVLSRGMGNASEVGRQHAIPGRFGAVVRTPGRTLMAFDELFKGIAFRMELGAQAWRAGKAKGLSGASLRSFVEKQTVEPDDAIFAAAVAHAERTTFNQDPGKLAKAVGAFRTALPAAGYVVPFISTPMNLIRTSVRRTPLGTANLALGLAREAAARIAGTPGGYRYETKYRDAVEQVVAWSALVALAGAMGDEDDPIITGSKQFDVNRKGEIDMAYRQAPPQSVKINGKWYSYARTDPFAAGLTLMVDGLRNLGKAKDGVEAASTVWRSSLGIISNATFLRGLSDFLEMVNTGDVKNWATNFATSWVPNIVRQPARAFEPNVLERKDQPASEIMKQGAFPARRGALVPKVDVWGRDVKAGVSPFGPTTDIPYRILSPVRVQEEDAGTPRELDRFIMRYNAMFPDAKWFPSTPDSKFSDGRGGTVQLTPSEYRDFLRTSGENAVKRLKGLRPLPPDASPRAMENRLAGIKRALDDARADARKRIAATKRRGQSVTR